MKLSEFLRNKNLIGQGDTHVVPVNGATVDQGGKFAQSFSEDVSNGAHEKDDVQKVLAFIDEHVEQCHH